MVSFFFEGIDLAETDIITPILDQHGFERRGQGTLQKREIFVDELLLQVDGIGRDNYTLFVQHRPEYGWDQIGQTLACSRACFDQSQFGMIEGGPDRLRHAPLLWARLIAA